MVAMNPEPRPATDGSCLHHLFEAQARRTPGLPAVACEDERLDYAALDRRATQLAARLRAIGVGPEQVVGLFVERSVDLIVGLLGILKAGGAYLPIDPGYPAERIAFMLADAGAAVVLTQSPLLPRLPAGGTRPLCLDRLDWNAPEARAPGAASGVAPGNLAYVIYTSGSTGRPKGVCIEHRNIVSYVQGIVERFRPKPGWRHATVSTVAADLGNTVIFPALATGGCLHVITQERAENPALLAEYFAREAIDVLKIVPSHLAALQGGAHPEQLMPRRCLILGGEASRLDWIGRLRAMAPGCRIHNHYGPTETTVGALTYAVAGDPPPTASGTLPLGQPLPNSSIAIVDAEGRPVPAGEVGELCIGGDGVARGYLKRPELTAERFVTMASDDGPCRRYRTGDLVRRLADGNLEFLGRGDDQVKIGGHRIEPGEVEDALRRIAGVREAVVLAQDDAAGLRTLTAHIVPERLPQPLWDFPSVHLLPDGTAVAHLNRNETEYLFREIFGLQAYLRHGIEIRDGDCVIDAGANIGLFTVFASRLARDLRIHAFEPNPAAFACLQANAQAWGATVQCHAHGLSDSERSAEMTFFEGLSLLSGFYANAAVEHGVVRHYVANQQGAASGTPDLGDEIDALIRERMRARTVPTRLRTLSDVIAEAGIERIDLLKINVEKSELDVLRGIAGHDWPKIAQLVIEIDQRKDVAPIEALLAAHGFELHLEQDPLLRNTELCYLYARSPARAAPPATADHRRVLPAPAAPPLTPAGLRHQLRDRLPPYMIPAAFALRAQLPLTANGKLDRQALLAAAVHAAPSARFVAPVSATERQLAALWSELLGVERIGADDDFFGLGGQSLTAIRMVARIGETFGVRVPLRHLFDHPTVAGLAAIVDRLAWAGRSPADVGGAREEFTL